MPAVKKAFLVGINYQGTDYELRGCLNDVQDWGTFFKEQGFKVTTLLEKEATKKAMVRGMTDLVTSLKPGDVGAISYSGHGTWVPDLDGDEPDGRDEALCPYDMGSNGKNLLLDDEIHRIFDRIVPGSRVLFITDSCNSGTVYRFLFNGDGDVRVRFIPPAHFLRKKELVKRMDISFGQSGKKTNDPLPGLIHYSGCKDNEFSNDAWINGRFNGAMTFYALKAFRFVVQSGGTYQDAWKGLRSFLPSFQYQQTPLLNALPELKKLKALT